MSSHHPIVDHRHDALPGRRLTGLLLGPALCLLLPATLAASCVFMLPVATPPNAIIFGSGLISVAQMARAGFLVNLAALGLIALLVLVFPRKSLFGSQG